MQFELDLQGFRIALDGFHRLPPKYAHTIMIGIARLKDLPRELAQYFDKLPESNRIPRIVGIVFCKTSTAITREEIRPELDYFNFRSGRHVNFYFAGYEISTGTDKSWIYCAQNFDLCRKDLEACSKWRYSGGTDLILLNALFDARSQSANLDWSTVEAFCFEELRREGVLLTVGMFFEKIFQYCEECYGGARSGMDEPASPAHLKATLMKRPVGGLSGMTVVGEEERPTALLRAEVERACKRLSAANADVQMSASQVQAATRELKDAAMPFREMYKDERLAKAKADALKAAVPEEVVDTIVAVWHTSKFPSVRALHKRLSDSGILAKLADRHGTSPASVGRWHKIFRKAMVDRGLVEKYRPRSSGKQERDAERFVSRNPLDEDSPRPEKRDSRKQELAESNFDEDGESDETAS